MKRTFLFVKIFKMQQPAIGNQLSAISHNPSVTGVFIPLWQRGIKGDFKIMLVKSPLAPLFQRGV